MDGKIKFEQTINSIHKTGRAETKVILDEDGVLYDVFVNYCRKDGTARSVKLPLKLIDQLSKMQTQIYEIPLDFLIGISKAVKNLEGQSIDSIVEG